jgi:hypothetical protein
MENKNKEIIIDFTGQVHDQDELMIKNGFVFKSKSDYPLTHTFIKSEKELKIIGIIMYYLKKYNVISYGFEKDGLVMVDKCPKCKGRFGTKGELDNYNETKLNSVKK